LIVPSQRKPDLSTRILLICAPGNPSFSVNWDRLAGLSCAWSKAGMKMKIHHRETEFLMSILGQIFIGKS
jgi:hypothetical protein